METQERRAMFRHQMGLVLIAGLVFLTNLGAASLFDEDEPKNAVCGREMFLRGDWIVPTFNAELRTDKPILIYWVMLCSYSVWGVNEFAARFGSAILAIGTTLLTYHLGRKLFDARVGFLAGVILCTCLMFSAVGRAVTPDSTLIFCTTLAFTAYVWGTAHRFGGNYGEGEYLTGRRRLWHEYLPGSRPATVPMYLAMGLAVLAKGPIGVLLPSAIIGLNLLVRQQLDADQRRGDATPVSGSWWRRCLGWWIEAFYPSRIGAGVLAMYVPLGAIIVMMVALPWYVRVGYRTDGAWLAGFLGDHNVGRFLGAKENHSGPIVYYLVVILMGTFPWSAFFPVAYRQLRQMIAEQSRWTPSLTFVSCWAGFWILFFSLASTKLPNYILPAYPAVALLLAATLTAWQRSWSTSRDGLFRHGCTALAVVGLVLVVAIPIAVQQFLPEETWLVLIGVIPLCGGLLARRASLRHAPERALHTLGITAVSLAVTIVGLAPAYVSRYQDGPFFGTLARQLDADGVPALATFDYFAPTLVFYARTPVDKLRKAREIKDFFRKHPQGMLLTRADRLDDIHAELPDDAEVLIQQRRFLRRHDLVLVGSRRLEDRLPEAFSFARQHAVPNIELADLHPAAKTDVASGQPSRAPSGTGASGTASTTLPSLR